jgi:putative acetyltransferase
MNTLRYARNKDSYRLIKLIDNCFREYPNCILDVENEMTELLCIYSYFKKKNGHFWVIEKNKKIIASMGIAPSKNNLELHKVYVIKNERRKGIARKLVLKAEKYAKNSNYKKIVLWSDTRFKEAHRMYLNLNYKKSPRTRKLYDISKTTEFYFEKNIN